MLTKEMKKPVWLYTEGNSEVFTTHRKNYIFLTG